MREEITDKAPGGSLIVPRVVLTMGDYHRRNLTGPRSPSIVLGSRTGREGTANGELSSLGPVN